MAKRIVTKIGDVFCVDIENTHKRYFQYICNDKEQLNSSVIRVFRKWYAIDSNPKIVDIVKDEIDFYAHTSLRDGIVFNAWRKVGKSRFDCDINLNYILFGICQDYEYVNGNIINVNPNTNWYLWKINGDCVKLNKQPIDLRDNLEIGYVKSYIEIINRIKYGYYRYTSVEYDTIKRIPYNNIDSYVKKDDDYKTIYLHFKGENAIQAINLLDNGSVQANEGNPLNLPLFWETNWKNSEFITAEEFNDVWNKYNKDELDG